MAKIALKKKFVYREIVKHLPNGKRTRLQLIEHPGAVLIVPLLSKDKILMLRQYRPAIGQYLLEFPAGTLERGERVAMCARRELIEETGFRAGTLKRLGKIYPVPGYSTEIITIFRAEKLTPAYAPGDADEIIQPRVMTRAQVRRLFGSGQIQDAKTIAALAMGKWL